MDHPEVEYRAYTREDEEQILDLLRVAMKQEAFPDLAGFWRWKHYDNPFGESPGMVAIGDGKVVGLRVFLRWEWRVGPTTFRAVRAVDTATHPEWKRHGIFEHMTTAMIERLTADGVDFIFNTPNQYSMPGYLKMGWTLVGRLPLRIRPQRPTRLAKVAAQRSGLGGATAILETVDNSAVLDVLRQDEVRHLVDRAGHAAAQRQDRNVFETAKTQAYLEWRYGQNRWYAYKAAFRMKGDSGALVICRTSRRGALDELLVTDVVALPDARSRRLAARLTRQLAKETGADYVAASGMAETLGLADCYIPVGQKGPNMTVRPLKDGLVPDTRSFASWGASFGDLELF